MDSKLHSYQSRLCSRLMAFIPQARSSVHVPSNLGNLLFLLKLCFIKILFGVSLSVTSSLSCLRAKIIKLGTTRLFQELLNSPPVVASKPPNLPHLRISFPLASTRLRASYHSSFGLLPPGSFQQGFRLFFMLLCSKEGKAFGSALR